MRRCPRAPTLRTRRGGGGLGTPVRCPVASNMSSSDSMSSFGWVTWIVCESFSWRLWIQLLGLGILAIGIWAWSEKDTFNNLSKLTNIALDPAFIFIWAGAITFIIGLCPICSIVLPNYCFCCLFSLKDLPFAGFTGCVGALRENTTLLAAYAIFLAILLLLEVQPHI